MALKSRNLMSDTGTNWNFEGPAVEAAGYYGLTSGTHTVSVSVQNFVGRVYLYGTLEQSPQDADSNNGWFPIKQKPIGVNQTNLTITVTDDSELIYMLNIPGSTNNVVLSIDGVTQVPLRDYTYDGVNLTLSEGAPLGSVMSIRIMGPAFSTDEFSEPYHVAIIGDGIENEFLINGGSISGNTNNVYVTIDGIVQSPFLNFTYSNGTLTFITAPPDGLGTENIFVTIYPPIDTSVSTDYWIQFPLSTEVVDSGNIMTSPIYGPRTTTTVVGTIVGNFAYVKAVIDRDYLELEQEDMPEYKELAVGAVSQVLINF